jgi:hypothetical protein
MKKLIMLMALIVVAMISMSQNKTGVVVTGATALKYPINFTAADTIDASETYWVLVDCKQNYSQTQSVAITLATVSGSPSVAISLEGKTSLLDSYTEIVSAVTWTTVGNNPVSLVTSSANKYRYFKIKFVASGATQKTKVTALTFVATYQNTTSVLATTGTFSGAVTTAALTASGLITANAGVTLGGGDHLVGSATSNIAFNTDKFTVAGATGNTVIAGTLAVTGVATAGVKLPAAVLNTDGSETLTAAQSGKMIVASKADGTTTVTLPDPGATTVGVVYYILQTADQSLVVDLTTADGNSIVCDGVATADAVTISTASHKIGAGMIVIGISATQWYIGGLNPESVLTPEAAD